MRVNQIFRIGGLGIDLQGDSDLEYILQGRFGDFRSSSSPQAKYIVQTQPVPIEPTHPPAFSTGLGWSLYQDQDEWVIWVRSQDRDPYLVGRFAPDFHSGNIFTSESPFEAGKYVFPISYPMGELLMTNLLGSGYGILLHSCGVINGEDGLVFAGVSTAGKTTTAWLWEGQPRARVINDDHTILRKIDGAFRVYGTPWHGRHGQGRMTLAEDAPLKMIFILKHAVSNQALRLSPAQAAAALLVRTFAPLWSPSAMAFTLQFLDELCQAVPCYELGFVPDHSVVEYVRCLSEG